MKKPTGRESEAVDTAAYSPEHSINQGIGAQLRDARLARGLSVEAVADALRIKAHHIAALEQGDVSGTAGMTYALGYLRSYAAYLGFDGAASVRQFKAEQSYMPRPEPLSFPVPVKEVKFPTGRILAFSLILAVLGYGGYYYVSRSGKVTEAHAVPPVPAEFADTVTPLAPPPPSPQPATATAPTSAFAATVRSENSRAAPNDQSATAAPLATPFANTTAANSTIAPSAQSLPVPAASTIGSAAAATISGTNAPAAVSPAAAQTQTASVGTPAAADGRVVLKASADAWVQIQGHGNEQIFTRILRAGESYTVPPRNDITLVTGNAGALEILVDGKTTGPLGAMGTVKRNISLDPDKLLTMVGKVQG